MKIFHACLYNADFIPAPWIWTSITWSLTRWKQIALQALRSGNWSQFQLTSMVLCVPHIPVNHILKYWAGMSYRGLIISATHFYFWNKLSEAKMLKVILIWEKLCTYLRNVWLIAFISEKWLACFQNMWWIDWFENKSERSFYKIFHKL